MSSKEYIIRARAKAACADESDNNMQDGLKMTAELIVLQSLA